MLVIYHLKQGLLSGMPRRYAHIRISINVKRFGMPNQNIKLELSKLPDNSMSIRRDGLNSTKVDDLTVTEFSVEFRKLINQLWKTI